MSCLQARVTKDTPTLIDLVLTTNHRAITSTVTAPLSLSDHNFKNWLYSKDQQQKIKTENY